jgi:hypothetical protein
MPLLIDLASPTALLREQDRTSTLPIVGNGPPGTFVLFPNGLRVSLRPADLRPRHSRIRRLVLFGARLAFNRTVAFRYRIHRWRQPPLTALRNSDGSPELDHLGWLRQYPTALIVLKQRRLRSRDRTRRLRHVPPASVARGSSGRKALRSTPLPDTRLSGRKAPQTPPAVPGQLRTRSGRLFGL